MLILYFETNLATENITVSDNFLILKDYKVSFFKDFVLNTEVLIGNFCGVWILSHNWKEDLITQRVMKPQESYESFPHW